jgi:hypothetical protein
LGTAGFAYYGSNNGGFTGYDGDDPLLLARWTEYSAFRPIFEGPRGGTQEVWQGYPPATEKIYQKYATIHTRLFPYMKAYALEAVRTGHPIMRMLPLHYPDDTETYGRNFDYLLGDWLLVAPVYLDGAYTRDVYLPAGRWIQYWTNEVRDGPDHVIEDVAEDSIPVFAKAGAIISLIDPSVQTLWPTHDPGIVDHTDVEDRMWVELFPSGSSSFTLSDGTHFTLVEDGNGFTFRISNAPLSRTYSLRAVAACFGGGEPSSVKGPTGPLTQYTSYDDWATQGSGWFYDHATGNLWIRDACLAGMYLVTQSRSNGSS